MCWLQDISPHHVYGAAGEGNVRIIWALVGVISFPLLTVSRFCIQINFRCKPSFREPGCRAVREVSPICPNLFIWVVIYAIISAKWSVADQFLTSHCQISSHLCFQSNVVRHHWVHRRRQTGKCRQCGKASVRQIPQSLALHKWFRVRELTSLLSPTGISTEVFISQQRDCCHQLLLVQTGGKSHKHSPVVQERRCGNQPGGSTPKPRPRFKSVRGRGRSTTDVKEEWDFKDGVHSAHLAHTANIFWLPGLLPDWATTKYQEIGKCGCRRILFFVCCNTTSGHWVKMKERHFHGCIKQIDIWGGLDRSLVVGCSGALIKWVVILILESSRQMIIQINPATENKK